ncbi:hypothetical protein VTO73DRAFT_5892 [Trametes versicolor]
MTFLKSFFPLAKDHDRSSLMTFKHAFRAVPQTAESAAQIYEPLVAALNKSSKRKSRCPGFVFKKTIERSSHPSRPGFTKPHICCFTLENAKHVRHADKRTRTELGYAELFININPDPSCDFFIDPPPDADRQAREAHEFARQFDVDDEDLSYEVETDFGLHIAFAMEVFARQHRLVVFSISMAGSFARIFRWDRAGCIVTEAFDIREHSELLLEFIWRFSQVSHTERGYDLTVAPATTQEEMRFRDAIRAHVRMQLEVEDEELDRAVRAHYQPGHATAVHVYSRPPAGTMTVVEGRRYIVSRPVVSPLYLEGRGTRGYWALCCETGRVVFLKDTWRSDSISEVEGDILERLNALGVRNVPSLVMHGDAPDPAEIFHRIGVRFHLTQTGFFTKQAWRCLIDGKNSHIHKRRHYRLVTDIAGYGLSTIRGTRELLHAAYDTFTAMRDALAKDSRIHRDLSMGNIILVKEPGSAVRRGYLIDWEASNQVDEAGEAKHAGRTGTWDFMSIRMLDHHQMHGKHTFKDDMESVLYVVFYCGLRYVAHDVFLEDFHGIIRDFFRLNYHLGDFIWGGAGKLANAQSRMFMRDVHFRSAALQEWVTTVMDFHFPPASLREKYKDAWDAAHLDAFWSEFLENRVLEGDDRVVHTLPSSGPYDSPPSPTTPAPSSQPESRKRDMSPSDYVDAVVPNPKKARRAEGKIALRRSERIRNQQNLPP